MHLAAEKGRLQVCEHLLELRADICALDNVSYILSDLLNCRTDISGLRLFWVWNVYTEVMGRL